MIYLKLSRILWVSALITLIFSFSPGSAPALLEQAAPYTVEALQHLNNAVLRIPPMLAPIPNCQFNEVTLGIRSIRATRTDLLINDAQAPKCEIVVAVDSTGIAIYNTGAAQCPSYCKSRENFRNNQWKRVGRP